MAPETAVSERGGDAWSAGVPVALADGFDVPTAFEAVTVMFTGVPMARPGIVQVVAGALALQECPAASVARYEVTAVPPFEVGGVQATIADW